MFPGVSNPAALRVPITENRSYGLRSMMQIDYNLTNSCCGQLGDLAADERDACHGDGGLGSGIRQWTQSCA